MNQHNPSKPNDDLSNLLADYDLLAEHLERCLEPTNKVALDWALALPEMVKERYESGRYGDLPKWRDAVEALPSVMSPAIDLNPVDSGCEPSPIRVGGPADLSEEERHQLKETLLQLHPWRKGPFELFGQFIDTEWRSDWKWDRLKQHIAPLRDRAVLDVGCGNGYHCWRMLGDGARFVLGVDPSQLYAQQFQVFKRYVPDLPIYVLPLAMEACPPRLRCFDTVFSMGVLYHRKSPIEHIEHLQQCLRPGGELVLETLVIDGGINDVLVPEGRYAKMRNVWFIPSSALLKRWAERLGLSNVRIVDVSATTLDEQRTTEWMRFESLKDFLNAGQEGQESLTVEGYPAPKRAVLLANA